MDEAVWMPATSLTPAIRAATKAFPASGSPTRKTHGTVGRRSHISPLKCVGLHPLKGNRRGQWAMTVNRPWRICFRFKGGDAYEVEIVEYH
jgi:hypothetical protein